MRIVVVEDMVLICEILCRICVREFDFDVVGWAHTPSEAIDLILSSQPDIVLLDLFLPQITDSLTVVTTVRRLLPHVRFLAVSGFNNDVVVRLVEDHNFDGFVEKIAEDLDTLKTALVTVASGRRYFSPRFLAARRRLRANPFSFDKRLSPRQREVLGLIGQSLSDDEIAKSLRISAETAKTHRKHIMVRLGMHSTRELIVYAVKNGLTRILSFRR